MDVITGQQVRVCTVWWISPLSCTLTRIFVPGRKKRTIIWGVAADNDTMHLHLVTVQGYSADKPPLYQSAPSHFYTHPLASWLYFGPGIHPDSSLLGRVITCNNKFFIFFTAKVVPCCICCKDSRAALESKQPMTSFPPSHTKFSPPWAPKAVSFFGEGLSDCLTKNIGILAFNWFPHILGFWDWLMIVWSQSVDSSHTC